MNSLKTFILVSLLIPQLVLFSCAPALLMGGAAAGATIAAYIKGELISNEPVTLDTAWGSTLQALDNLELVVTQKTRDKLTGKILALGAEGKEIEIHLKREAIHMTQIRIRVGMFGDETLSRHILREIQRNYEK